MPSATQPEYSMPSPSTKKRRREADGEVQMPFSSTLEASQNLLSAINNNERLAIPSNRGGSTSLFNVPRKAIPVSLSKRIRLIEDHHHELNNYLHHHNTPPPALSQSQSQQSFSHAHPETNSPAARPHTSTLLSPCHICHRKPTKKSDLDSFADCTGCGERTCYICIRACQGWPPVHNGDESEHIAAEAEDLSASFTMQDADDEEAPDNHHANKTESTQKPEQKQKKGEGGRDGEGGWNARGHRGVVCSRCCVEQGSEGDVVCLGCLAGMKGS
ncbi:hypothetical protein F5Y10DRAFT_164216 [Nemania abortiva]|nr:hypothetical protein F5Y10DRAFT_164216 [Nemania abortiva]